MKYKIFLFTVLLSNCITAWGQAPDWLWAKGAGGTGDDYASSVTVDASGNVYAAGAYSSSSITFGSTTLTNNGIQNIFLVKYDANGNVIWAVGAGNEGEDGISSIAIDIAGNIFITGWFSSDTLTIGSANLLNETWPGYKYDLFIAKYDNNGNPLWAESAGGNDDDVPASITTDVSGNVYVGGYFESDSISFDAFTLHNFTNVWEDLFIVKYDNNGNVIWAKSAGGNNGEDVTSVAVNNSEEVYIAGAFSSAAVTLDGVTITGIGNHYDMFVFKLDSAGTAIWGQTVSGNYGVWPYGINLDASGNYYITGIYQSLYITFGTITLTNSGGNSGTSDIFLVKYDSSGSVLWARGAGNLSREESYSVSIDVAGNAYIAGEFNSAFVTFGSTVLNNSLPGLYDIFLAKYDTSGNVQWAKSAGSTNEDGAYSIKANTSGEGYVAGYFSSSSILFSQTMLTNASPGNMDLFVAKFDGITGMAEKNNSFNSINTFPNPVTDKLTITTNNNSLSEIILYDIASQKLLQQKFTNTVTLNTSQLAKGMYLYEVRDKSGVVKKGKVVKE